MWLGSSLMPEPWLPLWVGEWPGVGVAGGGGRGVYAGSDVDGDFQSLGQKQLPALGRTQAAEVRRGSLSPNSTFQQEPPRFPPGLLLIPLWSRWSMLRKCKRRPKKKHLAG